jgi:hypothetical protein
VAQHIGIPLAVSEKMAFKQTLELFADHQPSFVGLDPQDVGTGWRDNSGHELTLVCARLYNSRIRDVFPPQQRQ